MKTSNSVPASRVLTAAICRCEQISADAELVENVLKKLRTTFQAVEARGKQSGQKADKSGT